MLEPIISDTQLEWTTDIDNFVSFLSPELIVYPITSIFRTERGIIPGYGLAPAHPGHYKFPTALLLMSENTLHSVTCVDVVGPTPGIVISTRRGFYGVQEDMYQGAPVFSIDNMPLRLMEPQKSAKSDEEIIALAFRAAYVAGGRKLHIINKDIRELVYLEFRSRPVSVDEYTSSFQYILDFSKISNKHIHMWFYHFLVCMFRMRSLRMNRNESFVRLDMAHVWWRDVALMLLKHFQVDFSVDYKNIFTRVRFTRTEFRRMLTRIFSVPFPRLVDDFAFIDAVTTRATVILDARAMATFDDVADTPGKLTRTKLHGKYVEYIGLHIAFPELTELIETNGLIL